MDIDRIFTADQIQVHPDLPVVIKDYSKAVIRANPPDILQFSLEYFQKEVTKNNSKNPIPAVGEK